MPDVECKRSREAQQKQWTKTRSLLSSESTPRQDSIQHIWPQLFQNSAVCSRWTFLLGVMFFLIFPKLFEYNKFIHYLFTTLFPIDAVSRNEELYSHPSLVKWVAKFGWEGIHIEQFLKYCRDKGQFSDSLAATVTRSGGRISHFRELFLKQQYFVKKMSYADDEVEFDVFIFRHQGKHYCFACKCINESDIGFLLKFNEFLIGAKKFHGFQYCVVGTCGHYGTDASRVGKCVYVTRAIKYDRGNLTGDMTFQQRPDKKMQHTVPNHPSGETIFSGNSLCIGSQASVDNFFSQVDNEAAEKIVAMETFDFFTICNNHGVNCYGALRTISDLCNGHNDKIGRLTCEFKDCIEVLLRRMDEDDISSIQFPLSEISSSPSHGLLVSYVLSHYPSSLSEYVKTTDVEDIWNDDAFKQAIGVVRKARSFLLDRVQKEIARHVPDGAHFAASEGKYGYDKTQIVNGTIHVGLGHMRIDDLRVLCDSYNGPAAAEANVSNIAGTSQKRGRTDEVDSGYARGSEERPTKR
eukprot:scaffold2738_cov314-Pinguiococcus_pyrenoidosus.AAC.1